MNLEPRWLSHVASFSIPNGDGTSEEGCSYACEDMSKPYADYTDEYKEAVAVGKEFVIMKGSFDSFVNRNNVVTTRVLLPKELGSPHKDMLAQLPVENIATWY